MNPLITESDKQISKEQVQEYYGQDLKNTDDLKTTACCSIPSQKIREILKQIHPEVISRFYGCGSPIPDGLDDSGLTVLDLGSGTGRDVYILSKLVGQKGKVIGVDMTDEQIECAQRHIPYHMQKFGYSEPNVEFKKGFIEDLKEIGIQDNSIDLVVSNCVVNLSPFKDKVLSEIFRVLKPGGELFFSDVFTDRRLPEILKKDKEVVGECLGGALYIQDFRRLLNQLGCPDYRQTTSKKIDITDAKISEKCGLAQFESITIRAFKIKELEDQCEDYGHVAYYQGTIPGCPNFFDLDDHHRFEKGKPMLVCGNTYYMLSSTRFASHFKILGDFSTHFGLFPCGPSDSKVVCNDNSIGGSCC